MMSFEVDPVKYGILWNKVETYEAKFDELSKKIDKMETAIESLLAMANQSRGALWVGIGLVSAFSAFVGFVINWLHSK